MVKKPSEEVLKAHNEAEIIIKENDIDRFLLNMFMDKKGINRFYTSPELVNEFLSSNWFLGLDLNCLLQIDNNSKRVRTDAYLTNSELIFKNAINKSQNLVLGLDKISDCSIDGKKVNMVCENTNYRIMFINRNLAKLVYGFILGGSSDKH